MRQMNLYYETYYGPTLQHAGNGNGNSRKNHKYIARVRVGDRFRYFYTQAEIAAYKAAKAVGGAVNSAEKAVASTRVGRAIGIGLQDELARKRKEYDAKEGIYRQAADKWRVTAKPGHYDDAPVKKRENAALKAAQAVDRAADDYNKTLDDWNNSLMKWQSNNRKAVAKTVGLSQKRKMEEAKKELSDALSRKPDIYERKYIKERGTVGRNVYREQKARGVAEAKAKYNLYKSIYADTPLAKIENAAKSIQKGASQVAKSISKVGSQAVSSITSAGNKALNLGKTLLSGLFGKKKK